MDHVEIKEYFNIFISRQKTLYFLKFHLNREIFDEEQIDSEGSREQKQMKSFECFSNLLKGKNG